jgi:hypothetical protein
MFPAVGNTEGVDWSANLEERAIDWSVFSTDSAVIAPDGRDYTMADVAVSTALAHWLPPGAAPSDIVKARPDGSGGIMCDPGRSSFTIL